MKNSPFAEISHRNQALISRILDPIYSPREVCDEYGFSLATYYRYIKDLNFPTLRVGFTNFGEQLARKSIQSPLYSFQSYDIQVIRHIGLQAGVIMKLIPCQHSEVALRSGKVDVAIGSLSWTQFRSKDLYGSCPYVFHDPPHGNLIGLKNHPLKVKHGERPKLGVPKMTIHADFAFSHLAHEFEICEFTTVATTIRALESLQVGRILLHPLFIQPHPGLEIVSKTMHYASHTAIWVNKNSVPWLNTINLALEKMFEQNLFSKLAHETSYITC